MIKTFFIAILGFTALMILWVVVQIQWKEVFHEEIEDIDVLAGRSTCGNCGCTNKCQTESKIQ